MGQVRPRRPDRPADRAAYLAAVKAAEGSTLAGNADLRDGLNGQVVGEQMLRRGITWAKGAWPDSPALTPHQRTLLSSRIWAAAATRDHANTEWLKGIVAEKGWPRRSQVGDKATANAWLIVQHADMDPAFQLRALRLIEPLVASGEVERRNYAYLYDRVMLKISGRQRYATQMTCRGGTFVPQPLEDGTDVEQRRREMGLNPLAEYAGQMLRTYGACQDRPSPPPPAKG